MTRRQDEDKPVCPACGKTSACTCELDADFASLAAEYTEFEQQAETVRRDARIVATYYTTLVASGVDEDAAMMLTQTWYELNVSVEISEPDEGGDDDE